MTDVPPPPPPSSPLPGPNVAAPPPPPPVGPSGPDRELSGFGVRFGSFILDRILYGLVAVPFIIAGIFLIVQAYDDCVTVGDEIRCPEGSPSGGSIALGVLLFFVGALVALVLYIRALALTGQTWGRKIVGVKVIRADDGEAPGWGKAIGRSLFEGLISPLVFYLGFLWMLWDDQNQTWHDKVAGTLVVPA